MKTTQVSFRVLVLAAISALISGSAASYAVSAESSTSSAAGTTTASDTSVDAWSLVYRDDFDQLSLDESAWQIFRGGNAESGYKSAENVIVQNGKLVLRTTTRDGLWYTAAISNQEAVSQAYGKYVIRMRHERGTGVRAVALLWPVDGTWPPEIDFYETSGQDWNRTKSMLSNHHRIADGEHQVMQGWVHADYTTWHRVGVEWTPEELRFTRDGEVVHTMTENISDQAMRLGLRTALEKNGGPDATTPYPVDLVIDWVKVYALTTPQAVTSLPAGL